MAPSVFPKEGDDCLSSINLPTPLCSKCEKGGEKEILL